MKTARKTNSGFTMIELMIVVFIFIILIGAIFAVLTTGNVSWRKGETGIELQQELRRAMIWISEELRQSGTSRISNVPADGIWYNTITFRIVSGVSGGAVTWEANDIQYALGGINGEQLLRTQAGVADRVLGNHIVSFEARRQNLTPAPSDIVEIALQAEKVTFGTTTVNLGLNFQVKLRN